MVGRRKVERMNTILKDSEKIEITLKELFSVILQMEDRHVQTEVHW